MPKEICQFADTNLSDPTSIEVVWGKESSHVQLHFQRHSFGVVGGQRTEVTNPAIDQYSDMLRRDDINKLIRALRRARDQAYGADA